MSATQQPSLPTESSSLRFGLTAREVQMLSLASRDQSNKEVARAFDTTEQVVKNRFRRIYRRLKVKNRAAAVAKALREGVIR